MKKPGILMLRGLHEYLKDTCPRFRRTKTHWLSLGSNIFMGKCVLFTKDKSVFQTLVQAP